MFIYMQLKELHMTKIRQNFLVVTLFLLLAIRGTCQEITYKMFNSHKLSPNEFIAPTELKDKTSIRLRPSRRLRRSRRKRSRKSNLKENTIKAHHYSNGKWTEPEHNMLLYALDILGNHWKAIQLFLGTRSCDQIRSHVQKHFNAIKRDAIKQLRKSDQGKKQLFMVTKQYMNFPFRCLLTDEDVKQVEEMKRKWFLSQGKKEHVQPKFEHKDYEDFDLPPLGNLTHEDYNCEYMKEIKKIDFIAKPTATPLLEESEGYEFQFRKEFDVGFNWDNLNQPENVEWQVAGITPGMSSVI